MYLHRKKSDGTVFYVGSGRPIRPMQKSSRSTEWLDFTSNNDYFCTVLEDKLTKEESLILELEYYNYHKTIDTLLNHHPPKTPKVFPVKEIHKQFTYDETSPTCLRWKNKVVINNMRVMHDVGDIAGNQTDTIRKVYISGVSYSLHKVVWVMHYGNVLPGTIIDHIDGNPLNNKISNLRAVTQTQNMRNKKSCGKNKSGIVGVRFCGLPATGSWRAQCRSLEGGVEQKYFSVKTYGHEQAFLLACEHRTAMIVELNLQGAGYTERHGT